MKKLASTEVREYATHEHESFTGFVKYFHSRKTEHGVFYRGQMDPSWHLEPSIMRLARRAKRDSSDDEEKRLIASFRESAIYLGISLEGKNEEKIFAIAQHHGMQTPLLDWTKSPYVAAFFAYADYVLRDNYEQLTHVSIWSLDTKAAEEESLLPGTKNILKFVQAPDPHNRRILAQQGAFTRSVPTQALDTMPGVSHHLVQHLLPARYAATTLIHLNRMNINYRTVFPDIGGSCLHANLVAQIPSYEGIP